MDTNNNLYDSQFYIYIYVLLCPHCHIDICSSKQCLGALKTQIPTLIANVYTNTHTHVRAHTHHTSHVSTCTHILYNQNFSIINKNNMKNSQQKFTNISYHAQSK